MQLLFLGNQPTSLSKWSHLTKGTAVARSGSRWERESSKPAELPKLLIVTGQETVEFFPQVGNF